MLDVSRLRHSATAFRARGRVDSSPSRWRKVNASLGDDRVEMSVADEGRGGVARRNAVAVQEVLPEHRPGRGTRGPGHRPRPCDLQRDRGGSRRPHLGRKRRPGPGLHVHLHPAGGRRSHRRGRESRSKRQVADRGTRNLARILAVDDDPTVLRYVRDALSRAGYAPVVTTDPNDALRIVESDRPRLVLLDLMLPGSDGIELMKSILEIAEVPVIFLSAYGRDEIIARAIEAGAADYMVKPFSPTELVARVRGALRRRLVASTGRAVGALRAGRPGHRLRRTAGERGRECGPYDSHRV